MLKKIAYIELDTHAEIAANFMTLMGNSVQFSIDYYFSEKIISQLGKHESNVFFSESTELLNQLRQKKYDLVIIGTVHRYFNLFNEIVENYNSAVIIHNLNFVNISRFQLFKNIFKKDFKYRLKLWLKEDLLSAPEVFKKAKNLLVLDEGLIRYRPKFNLKLLPVFFLKQYKKPSKSIITVVVPGTVSQHRRDYQHIFESIQTFKLKSSIQFIFLGKAENKELILLKNLERKLPKNISLRYFEEKVPVEIFDDLIMKASILWCPIQKETEFFSNKEIYGKTKMSGNIGDAVKYGKFAIFPGGYVSSHPFIIAESKNIEEQLYSYDQSMEYDFQEEFNKNKITAELEETLHSLL
ncbi:hypothetical protein FNJ88_12400 [Chryseobacterium sp. SNU WT5]|uniref:hypothetical protein n=1 Tax=Chryseobacterium sp. SNU WT5 TaxID=2594269 RepID=UPI001180AD04|nr:hypothetical protein [Chryseobacterium sp. SNU WT5]QDP86311.1 hypothetical protein FNJ88_12400 [Chryseobacterium sp. SNU WT5]